MPDLSGLTVLLTRQPQDNAPLARALAGRGATVLELPCVRIEPVADAALAAAVRALTPQDLLVLTSRAGADAVLRAVPAKEIRAPVAAVGEGTARRLAEAGVRAFVPSRPSGEALGREVPLPAGRVLLARADRGSPDLPSALRARGAAVEQVVAYRTIASADGDIASVRRRLASGRVDLIVFASPSAVDGLSDAISVDVLRRARVVAIGPTTASRVRERIGVAARVAADPGVEGLVRAIERWHREATHVAVD